MHHGAVGKHLEPSGPRFVPAFRSDACQERVALVLLPDHATQASRHDASGKPDQPCERVVHTHTPRVQQEFGSVVSHGGDRGGDAAFKLSGPLALSVADATKCGWCH